MPVVVARLMSDIARSSSLHLVIDAAIVVIDWYDVIAPVTPECVLDRRHDELDARFGEKPLSSCPSWIPLENKTSLVVDPKRSIQPNHQTIVVTQIVEKKESRLPRSKNVKKK